MHHMDADRAYREQAWRQLHKNWTNPGSNIPQNGSCTTTKLLSLKLPRSDEQDMQNTAGGVGTTSHVTFSYGPHHKEEQVLDDQL